MDDAFAEAEGELVQIPELLARVIAAEILLPGAHRIPGILHPDIDVMPLSIVQ